MSDHTIKIKVGGYTGNDPLKPWLSVKSDNEAWTTSSAADAALVTTVTAGQTVQFSIEDPNITSIDEIRDDSVDGFDIFSVDPTARNSWTGTVGTVKGEEKYTIKYTLNNRQYEEDPKMKMT